MIILTNPLVPDAGYSECPDKLVSLKVKLQLNHGFLFLHPRH